MNKQGMVLFLLLTMTFASGCSKLRGLTRRDYALLRDPFATRADEGLAEDESPVPGVEASTAGFVRIGEDSGATEPLSDRAVAEYPGAGTEQRTAQATGSPSGFQGIRVRGMGNAISTEIGPSVSDFVGKAPDSLTVAAKPDSQPDTTQMAAFVREQAEASGMNETADELGTAFSKEAEQTWSQWQDQVAEVNQQKAAPFIRQVSQSDQQTTDVLDELTSPDSAFASENENVALPLIQNRQPAKAPAEKAAAPTGRAESVRPVSAPAEAAEPLLLAPRPVKPAQRAEPPVGISSPFTPITPDTQTKRQQASPPIEQPVFDDPVSNVVAPTPAKEEFNPFSRFESFEDSTPTPVEKESVPEKSLDSGFGWRRPTQ